MGGRDDNFSVENGSQEFRDDLERLAWQLRQAAKGDYSQQSARLGELSDAFNEMIRQVKERETKLKKELETSEKRAEATEGYNELLVELLSRRKEWLLVVDMDSRKILYCNKEKKKDIEKDDFCQKCQNRLSFRSEILKWNRKEQYKVWEMQDDSESYYRITSFYLEWKEHHSCVYIIVDITDEKRMTSTLTSKAYHDAGTGIKNRLFFEEYMEMILKEKQKATLCYLDLDGLKYVNDKFGHQEGDIYIQCFVELIRGSFRSSDAFARIGGDEFCLVLTGGIKELIERKMAELLHVFQTEEFREYRCSFSYGIVELSDEEDLSLKELLDEADAIMYECKRKNKEKYPELVRG